MEALGSRPALCGLKGGYSEQTNNVGIPYTQVNKRIHLFPKLEGNMRLLPNMASEAIT